jgi:hypothetical protein
MQAKPDRSAGTPYYQPSGKVARGALLIGMGYGLAILPGAFLYACATMRAPVYINFIVLVIFGLWIAVVVDLVALKARIRNRAWIARFAVALALCAWYFHWAVWMAMAMQRHHAGTLLHSAAVLALHPGALLAAATELALHNAWGLGALPMVAVWLVEAYVLVQMAPGLGHDRVVQPFCEASEGWAEQIAVRRKFACIDQAEAVAHLLEQAPQQLTSVLSSWTAPAPHYAEVTLYRCRDGNAYVSIRNIRARSGPRGAGGAGAQEVVTALRLPGMDVDALIEKLIARADAGMPGGPAEDEPEAPELASARALFQAARFADAFTRAQAHAQAPQRALRLEANQLCALACMRQNRWGDAGRYWQAVFDDEPAVRNALQLAATAVMAGAIDTAHEWFGRARALNGATRELPALSLLTTFVSALDMAGRPASAMHWLDEIRETYCACRVTDPTTLFANRMPLFNEFLDRSAPIVLAALGRQQGLRWFAAMLGRLDEAGNVELGHWLDQQERSLAG